MSGMAVKFAQIRYKANVLYGKFDNKEIVKIENMKFSKDLEEHMKPVSVRDFSPRHRYAFMMCKCETEDPCTDITQCKNCIVYSALIEKLAGIYH